MDRSWEYDFALDGDWDRFRDKCNVCERPHPSIHHPSFQYCIPVLVKRIKILEEQIEKETEPS